MSSVSKYSLSPSSSAAQSFSESASDVPILFILCSSKSDHNPLEHSLRPIVDIARSGMTHSIYNLLLQVPYTTETRYHLRDTLTDSIVVHAVRELLKSDVHIQALSSKTTVELDLKQASMFRRVYKFTWEGRSYRWELDRKQQLHLSRQKAGQQHKEYESIGCAKIYNPNLDQAHQTYSRFQLQPEAFDEIRDKLAFEHVTILTLCLLIDKIGSGFATFPIIQEQSSPPLYSI
ncbi:hypothetical protein INT43_000706 [Umbelopsis isabellina]|uniref:Uncharacterized protein n=1 Tax=Mortierella isabellina TaxID=91625 RepID=A0A8H7UM37_MORIS|nr:hypothetical protein INT43_000706 [Umbelopsis isabellina]